MNEKYKDVPFSQLIEPNKTIKLSSVFMFEDQTQLFAFLHACEELNCEVYFENEQLKVNGKTDTCINIRLIVYMTIKNDPRFVKHYLNYILTKENNNEVL